MVSWCLRSLGAAGDATEHHLSAELEDYALIIAGEAHYRNPEAPYRAVVLRHLPFGPRKEVVLLTATLVNNSLFKLYNLMR